MDDREGVDMVESIRPQAHAAALPQPMTESRPVRAGISGGVLSEAVYPDLAAALRALRPVASYEAWLLAFRSAEQALAPEAEPGIRAILDRDGNWTAPLPVGHDARETEISIRWVDQ